IARMEGTPHVPGTPEQDDRLVTELNGAALHLDAVNRLRIYGNALQVLEGPESKKNHFFLLILDPSEMRLIIKGYKSSDSDRASPDYLDAEKGLSAGGEDAVLVSVESISMLRRAYPNYYLDTNLFVRLVEKSLVGDFTSIRKSPSHMLTPA